MWLRSNKKCKILGMFWNPTLIMYLVCSCTTLTLGNLQHLSLTAGGVQRIYLVLPPKKNNHRGQNHVLESLSYYHMIVI